jgi:hypothetical protein
MNNLIYFSPRLLSSYDQKLKYDDYIYRDWFNIPLDGGPDFVSSRVHAITPPWNLAPTLFPMPAPTSEIDTFDHVMDSIADEYCRQAVEVGRTTYLYWSGGIDSTSMLVGLLKHGSKTFLDSLTVLLNQSGIGENAYFYHRYIKGKLKVQDADQFEITANNVDHINILDGDAGNQCLGETTINSLAYANQFQLLDSPWNNQFLDTVGFNNITLRSMVSESTESSPVPIRTGYDYLWWINFNFKFADVLVNKCPAHFKNINPAQRKRFFENNLIRFYQHPKMQIWSLLSTDLRREKTKITQKYFPKKYINDFDHNDLWFSSKTEFGSRWYQIQDFLRDKNKVFAIDADWNFYNIDHVQTRRELGKILKKS